MFLEGELDFSVCYLVNLLKKGRKCTVIYISNESQAIQQDKE